MTILINIIIFILILSVIVAIHEFGHFIFAKLMGVYVYEYAIGMGPRIIDTGGIELKNVPFMEEIKAQAQLAIDEADVIILVTDGRVGVTNGDKDVIKIF